MKAVLAVLLTLFAGATTMAQPPDSLWSRTFGGAQIDQAYSVRQTADGGFILTGWTQSFGAGSYDLWLIRTDASGDSLWTRTFGGTGEDRGTSVIEVSDGFVVAGRTSSFPSGNENFYLLKTDLNGDTVWTRVYGGTAPERAYAVRPTTDGGYIVAGNSGSGTTSDFWLIKTDASGDSTWSRKYGTPNIEDWCNSAQQTSDGGYVLAGYTAAFGAWDFWMVKTNENGDSLWSRNYGGPSTETCRSIQQTTDGGYILGGNTTVSGFADMYLVKTDANGDTLWTRQYGGSSADECYWVEQTFDGGYVMSGYKNSGGDMWVVKTGTNGDSTWSLTLGGSNTEVAYSVQQTSDSGYVLAGYTMSFGAGSNDAWLVRLGAAVPQAGVEVSPSQLNFPDVQVGDSIALDLTIRSTGEVDLEVTEMVTLTDFHADFQDPVMLPPGDSLIVPVIFAPTQAINYVDTLRIVSNAPTSPTAVRLTGTGTTYPTPGITVIPLELDFGYVWVGDTASLPIVVHSTGSSELTVSSIQAPQDFMTDFVPPQVLPPGDSMVVTVMFAPMYYLEYDDSVHVFSDALEGPVGVHVTGHAIIDAAGDASGIPKRYALSVYPNPFNAVTRISFDLPGSGYVSLKLYDALGREVKVLADEVRAAGSYSVMFDGEGLASGVYLCRMEAGKYTATRRLVLIK